MALLPWQYILGAPIIVLLVYFSIVLFGYAQQIQCVDGLVAHDDCYLCRFDEPLGHCMDIEQEANTTFVTLVNHHLQSLYIDSVVAQSSEQECEASLTVDDLEGQQQWYPLMLGHLEVECPGRPIDLEISYRTTPRGPLEQLHGVIS